MKTNQQSMSVEAYKAITNQQKAPRKQPEGLNQRIFGQLLNGAYKHRLSPNLIYWTYSGAGERKPLKTGVQQKRKGLQKGDSDYRFEIKEKMAAGKFFKDKLTDLSKVIINIQRTVYIEFKRKGGSLSQEQKIFFKNHEGLVNVSCYIVESPEEGIKILEREGILLTK